MNALDRDARGRPTRALEAINRRHDENDIISYRRVVWHVYCLLLYILRPRRRHCGVDSVWFESSSEWGTSCPCVRRRVIRGRVKGAIDLSRSILLYLILSARSSLPNEGPNFWIWAILTHCMQNSTKVNFSRKKRGRTQFERHSKR